MVEINKEASLGYILSLVMDQMGGGRGGAGVRKEVNLGHLIAMKRPGGRAGLGEEQGVRLCVGHDRPLRRPLGRGDTTM